MTLTELRALVSPKAIAANWTENVSNRIPYLGATLFPSEKKAGLDLSWILGSNGLPISLMPSAFDAKATFRDRIGLEKVDTEMPFFREGFKLKEKDRQDILRIKDQKDPYLDAALRQIFRDAANLLEGALVVPERMIMSLLFPVDGNMGIEIKANGVDYTYDYDPGDAWKTANYSELASTAKWDTAANSSTADPFEDLRTLGDKLTAVGSKMAYVIMNSATFATLRSNPAVKNMFLTLNGQSVGYLTDAAIVQVLKDAAKLNGIIVYDKQYKDESGNAHKFVPDGYITVIPEGNLGNTWRGTTPEEADLQGSGEAEVAIVENGIAITQETTVHPVNINTYASEIVLPSFERMREVAVMKVY